jgi:hypothetical protein
MNLFVQSERWPTRQAFDPEVKKFFGLDPKEKWPEQGMPRRTIQGIHCWVEPIARRSDGRAKFTIRAKAVCPKCQKAMPIGRMQQHSKVHK